MRSKNGDDLDSDHERLVTTDPPDLPEGIDYERWARLVKPVPREAFADSLDLLNLLDT
jgi:hypothetical protein